MINLLHIPEGVRDIYGQECINKAKFENEIKKCMHSYGYGDVVTPSFEYFDIFNKERGTMSSRDMYKFFDKDGNTLVLRPDITPPMARVTAKYFKDSFMPVRLCYRAKQYINHSSLQGKLKETTQLGAELYNDASVYADFEILLIAIKSILSCGVQKFQLEIGITDFYYGITEKAGIDGEEEEKLRELLEQKNFFGLENFARACNATEDIKVLISGLAELYGGTEIFEKVKKLSLPEKSLHALERLESLNTMLAGLGYDKYVSFDLSMPSKFSYYTGIFFRGITYGTGEPIAYGGRYDKLVKQFGLDVPAIGFSITLDYMMMGLEREGLMPDAKRDVCLLFYGEEDGLEAFKKAEELRAGGQKVRMVMDNDGSISEKLREYHDMIINDETKKVIVHELETFDIGDVMVLN